METGIGLAPTLRLTMEEQRALVREAMGMGYTSAWTPAGATSRDAFHVCSQWAAAGAPPAPGASGIGTGISVVPVSHWTAPQLAATAGTVGELAGGRFILGVGTGGAHVAAPPEADRPPAHPPPAPTPR